MSVSEWIASAPAVQTYAPLNGALPSGGVLVGEPSWDQGVDGQCLSCGPQQGATVPTTAKVARGYPMSVSVWFRYESGAATANVLRWGNSPGMGFTLYGVGDRYPAGTVEGWCRMSNGKSALSARSATLAAGRWHLATMVVTQRTLWGGANARMYVNGVLVGSGSYAGGLFDIVNFDRPSSVTLGVGEGAVRVDEFVAHEADLSAGQIAALYASADDLEAGTLAGWGVTW